MGLDSVCGGGAGWARRQRSSTGDSMGTYSKDEEDRARQEGRQMRGRDKGEGTDLGEGRRQEQEEGHILGKWQWKN